MNDDLSAQLFDMYKTASQEEPSQEDTVKQAQYEYLLKVAADNGVDIESLTDDQVQGLYNDAFCEVDTKTAAEQEYEQQKEANAWFAESDARGRVMAHAFTDEMNKIAAAANEGSSNLGMYKSPESKSTTSGGTDSKRGPSGRGKPTAHTASGWSPKAKSVSDEVEILTGGSHGAAEKVNKATQAGRTLSSYAEKGTGAVRKAVETLGKNKGRNAAIAGGAALALGGAAAAGHYAGKKKEASALDFEAAKLASLMVEQAGLESAGQAAERFDYLFAQGIPEINSKVASAQDFDSAVYVRALELSEMMGYPVSWS